VLERGLESFQATNLLGAVVNDVDYRRTRYAYAYQYQSEQYKAASRVEVSP